MTDPAPDFEALFGLLKKHGVRFVVIGGLSCISHKDFFDDQDQPLSD